MDNAERPARRLVQLATDLVALGWLAAGSWLAWWTFEQLMRLQALGSGTEAGAALARAGRTQAEAVVTLATGAAVLVVLVVLVPVLLWWLPARWRYARAAGAAAAVRAGDTELLALRALVHLPPRRLLTVGEHPAASWRSRDPAVCRRLADLELARLGLRGTAVTPPFPSGRNAGQAPRNTYGR